MSIAFTKTGLDNLKKELEELQKNRPAAVKNLQTARKMGDLSENAAYKVARSKLSSIDNRIRSLQKVIDKAYIPDIKFNGMTSIGCMVTVSENGPEQTFQIVGSYESDLANQKISIYSPVGRALIGKRVGDVTKITTPSGIKEYKILKVVQL